MKARELAEHHTGMTLVRNKQLHHITTIHHTNTAVLVTNKYRPHLKLVLSPNEDIEVEP